MSSRDPASFRDNYGFVFWEGGNLYRQVNANGGPAYDSLMKSGLYEDLTERGLLIRHKEVNMSGRADAHKFLKPEMVPLIIYPFEWSFSQLKDAALATLEIQKRSLEHDMTLRDASAYNIQFVGGMPCLIDTLSFEEYHTGDAWQAYRQFCQHFLAPLALMSYRDADLLQLLRVHIDGIPLPLAAKLLPLKAQMKAGIFVHLKIHAGLQRRHQSNAAAVKRSVSRTSLLGLLDNLERTIRGLEMPKAPTEWGDYYEHTNYSTAARDRKAELVGRFAGQAKPRRVLDLGANNGYFSRVVAASAELVISSDIDPVAVDDNYRRMKRNRETTLLPMLVDLTNPSPALGWANAERQRFGDRVQADLVMALALVHHLAISNNVPLDMIAGYLAELGSHLIIEFVPKTDSQVKRLLATRKDIFPDYTTEGFEAAFGEHFEIMGRERLKDSERILYLMRRLER